MLRSSGEGGDRLHVRYVDMNRKARAAALRIDPLLDRAEYNALMRWEVSPATTTAAELVAGFRAADDPTLLDVAMRVENLGVLDWPLWAWGGVAATDVVDERADVTVLDLGGFS
ncbi:ATP-binding protein, partial [Schumannella luteola]